MESTAAWVLFANRIFSQIHETAAPSHHQLSLVRPRKKKGARRRVVKPVAGCCLVGVGPPLTLMVPWKLRLFTGTIRRLRSHQVIAECLAPFLKLGCAIAVKRWVLGPTTPGRRDRSESLVPTTETLARLDSYRVVVGVKAPGAHSSHATRHTPRPSLFSLRFRSEWNLLRSWLMARLLPGGRLCGVARLVGTHYDGISTIFRLLGAKVSSERNAPPRLSARQVCRLQCACRSCVVGRRPCACVLRVCRVSCVGPQRAASSLEWRRRAMVPDERPHRARASSKPNGVPQVGKRIYWPGSGLDLTEFDLLEIGDDVTFASRSVYMPSDAHAQAPIKIDAGAMVADRCVLLPGVSVGRNAVLASKLPDSIPSVSIDRQCGSSQQSIQFAAQGVMSGTQDMVLAHGIESMTRVPMGSTFKLFKDAGLGINKSERLEQAYPGVQFSQFMGAEMLVKKHGFMTSLRCGQRHET